MKQDHRRLSLQKHEIAYSRRLANKILKEHEHEWYVRCKYCRLAKMFLKVTKK